MGGLGDSLTVIFSMLIALILMFVFPVMTMADRTDDISQTILETAITEHVDKVATTGKLSADDYNKLIETINSTGNTYNIEMQIQVLDENPGKKTTQADSTKIGENVYYSMYTSQILDAIFPPGGGERTLALKEGDIYSVSGKNTNVNMAELFKNMFYSVSGNGSYSQASEHARVVTANGNGN